MMKKRIVALLVAFAFVFVGTPVAYADEYGDECDHDWEDSGYGYCYCYNCGATKPHNWVEYDSAPGSCQFESYVSYYCTDCYAFDTVYGGYAPHTWSETLWWDMDDDDYYVYGKYCTECDTFQKVVKTVKKGKNKQILPKSFLKGAKKKYVFYNKKKVKATKNGKVKGKKRGSVATITWDVKYRNHRGYTWWETYEVDVKVK